jgi:hypothetical protein
MTEHLTMTIRTLGAALCAIFALAGCRDYGEPQVQLSPAFGDAVRHNIAMQTINPEGSKKTGPTGLEGHRAAKAIDAYQKAEEKDVELQDTKEN